MDVSRPSAWVEESYLRICISFSRAIEVLMHLYHLTFMPLTNIYHPNCNQQIRHDNALKLRSILLTPKEGVRSG